jgi:hypothetical protein
LPVPEPPNWRLGTINAELLIRVRRLPVLALPLIRSRTERRKPAVEAAPPA